MPILTACRVSSSQPGCGDASTLSRWYPFGGWWTSDGGAFTSGRPTPGVAECTLTLNPRMPVLATGIAIAGPEEFLDSAPRRVEVNGEEVVFEQSEDSQVVQLAKPLALKRGTLVTVRVLENYGSHFVALRGLALQYELDDEGHFINERFNELEEVLGPDYEEVGGDNVDWVRAPELFDPADLALFENVEPGDVLQGDWGDCWLLSALAAMAEFPDFLRTLFEPKTVSTDGKYKIRIWDVVKSRWVHMVIDDRIPCLDDRPIGCRPHGGELWTLLLEKAFAQFAGNYTCLGQGGPPVWALMAMAGSCNGLRYWNKRQPEGVHLLKVVIDEKGDDGALSICDYRQVWGQWPDGKSGHIAKSLDYFVKSLAQHDEENHVMVAFTAHAQSDEMHGGVDRGIYLSHAYALISVLADVAGSGRNFMLLRNPHGAGEWTGAWGADSAEWDAFPELAAALFEHMPTLEDDGLFVMEDRDFFEVFDYIDVVEETISSQKRALATRDRFLESQAKAGGEEAMHHPCRPKRVVRSRTAVLFEDAPGPEPPRAGQKAGNKLNQKLLASSQDGLSPESEEPPPRPPQLGRAAEARQAVLACLERHAGRTPGRTIEWCRLRAALGDLAPHLVAGGRAARVEKALEELGVMEGGLVEYDRFLGWLFEGLKPVRPVLSESELL